MCSQEVKGGSNKKEGRKIFPRCSSLFNFDHESHTHTHTQRVGSYTSLSLWHHHQWQQASDNRKELKSVGKLSSHFHSLQQTNRKHTALSLSSDTALFFLDRVNFQQNIEYIYSVVLFFPQKILPWVTLAHLPWLWLRLSRCLLL